MENEYRQYPRTGNDETLWTVEGNSNRLTTKKEDVTLFSNTPRQQLETYFTASLFLIALLFLTLIMSIFAGTRPGLFSNVCHTPQCVRSALTLLEAMNTSVNPCDDFYQFACGNYKADYPADVEDESIQNWMTEQTIKQKKFFIGELRKENSVNDPSGVRAARRVFKACQNMAAINAVGMTSLWATLEKLGLPRHPLNYTGNELTWTRSLGRALRYLALDPIVGFGVSPSIRNSAVNVIALFTPEDTGDVGIFGGWSLLKLINKKTKAANGVNQWNAYVSKIVTYVVEADGKKYDSSEQLAAVTANILKVFKVILAAVKADESTKDVGSVLPTQMTVADFQKMLDNSSTSGTSKVQ